MCARIVSSGLQRYVVKIFILYSAARRHFHHALGHLWGGALISVPDENTGYAREYRRSVTHCWWSADLWLSPFSCLQLQQADAGERRIRAQTFASSPNHGEWEDSQVAVHSAVWGAHHRNQETTERGELLDVDRGLRRGKRTGPGPPRHLFCSMPRFC